MCNVFSVVDADCPNDVSKCGPFKWRLTANLTDTNGTGIDSVSLRQGTGNLTHTTLRDPLVQVKYEASCCSQIAEVVAVDKVGNVGKCYHSIVSDRRLPRTNHGFSLQTFNSCPFLLSQVRDFDPPGCQVVSLRVDDDKCPKDLTYCRNHKWVLIANLTDGGGTGVERIYLHHGDGTLTNSPLNASVVEIRYQGTCCAQAVDFRAVDKAGNEGRCYYSVVSSAGSLTLSLWLCLLATSLMATL